jgi:protein subunit release factor B
MLCRLTTTFSDQPFIVRLISSNIKKRVDFSKVPELNEKDLREDFVRGDGPGGQATNKTSNCVVLTHIPTNIIVKCHATRYLIKNREEARKILLNKLDEHYNKEMSVENQIKRIEKEKSIKRESKDKKLRMLKTEFKKKIEEENKSE